MRRPTKHVPTDVTRAKVEAYVACGLKHEEIAALIGVSVRTLQNHYRHEIEVGASKATAAVASALFANATNKSGNVPPAAQVQAQTAWLKMRSGWTDGPPVSVNVNTGPTVNVEQTSRTLVVNLKKLPGDELARLVEGLGKVIPGDTGDPDDA